MAREPNDRGADVAQPTRHQGWSRVRLAIPSLRDRWLLALVRLEDVVPVFAAAEARMRERTIALSAVSEVVKVADATTVVGKVSEELLALSYCLECFCAR